MKNITDLSTLFLAPWAISCLLTRTNPSVSMVLVGPPLFSLWKWHEDRMFLQFRFVLEPNARQAETDSIGTSVMCWRWYMEFAVWNRVSNALWEGIYSGSFVIVNPSCTCSVKSSLSHFELALIFQQSFLRWISSLFCVPDTLKSCKCLAYLSVNSVSHCSAQVTVDF